MNSVGSREIELIAESGDDTKVDYIWGGREGGIKKFDQIFFIKIAKYYTFYVEIVRILNQLLLSWTIF